MKMCGILPPVAKRLKFAGHYGAPHINRIQFKQKRYFDLISSGGPGRSVLLVALAAVNRPGSIRLEWDLGLLAAFGAGYICHFSGASVVAIPEATAVVILSLKHLLHYPVIDSKNRSCYKKHLTKSL
jgi:hypothetical protein